ncbi:hypothetical protein [Thalassotalea sp. ND16A]|uniref:hypothetical protein n=1 Tax=Thalassotalea sp. ND16A TaxID=1535422 RepID=UPI000519FCE2|nr:hypothetical protein [Thalassotalea sp. ND16A]KGJ99893.1 hypothetical protein ND16A_3681 [Thalassotalea sp. ND16A]
MKVLLLLVVVFTTSCVQIDTKTGNNFDDSFVKHIKKGQTNKSDIKFWFGEPNSMTVTTTGDIYSYIDMRIKSSATFLGNAQATGNTRSLTVIFSEDDTVKDFTYSVTNTSTNLTQN